MREVRFRPPLEGVSASPARPVPWRLFLPGARALSALLAGSGLLTLLSLMGGSGPSQLPLWAEILFPLDFAGLAPSVTLLLGFALVLTAAHLWDHKRRACFVALALSAVSVLVHLVVNFDAAEALSSCALLALLFFRRSEFQVGASRPSLLRAASRAALALAVAALYGALGFWMLEPGEFHRNFHWWEAALRTLRIMLFLPTSHLVPHTQYAAWFLDSLFWISAAAFNYTGFVLFHPVAYRFHLNLTDADSAHRIAEAYASSGQDFFKLYPDKSYFFSASRRSFIAYSVSGSFALTLGDPVGPASEAASTIAQFAAFCRRQGWRFGFHQVGSSLISCYRDLGLRTFKVGDDALVDLTRFSLAGSAMKEFRNTVNRLDRLGYSVDRIDAPLSDSLLDQLHSISDLWLTIPGHRERRFTLGSFNPAYVRSTTVYVVCEPGGRPVAFLNLVPSFAPGLATVDLMRRVPDSVNGLMDYLFAKVFLDLRQRGLSSFSLGMAPLDDSGAGGRLEHVVHGLMRRFPSLFRADSLRRFKAKYAHHWSPRYAVYQRPLDLPRLALALRRISESPRLRGAA